MKHKHSYLTFLLAFIVLIGSVQAQKVRPITDLLTVEFDDFSTKDAFFDFARLNKGKDLYTIQITKDNKPAFLITDLKGNDRIVSINEGFNELHQIESFLGYETFVAYDNTRKQNIYLFDPSDNQLKLIQDVFPFLANSQSIVNLFEDENIWVYLRVENDSTIYKARYSKQQKTVEELKIDLGIKGVPFLHSYYYANTEQGFKVRFRTTLDLPNNDKRIVFKYLSGSRVYKMFYLDVASFNITGIKDSNDKGSILPALHYDHGYNYPVFRNNNKAYYYAQTIDTLAADTSVNFDDPSDTTFWFHHYPQYAFYETDGTVEGTRAVFVSRNQNYYWRSGFNDNESVPDIEEHCYAYSPLLVDSTLYFWSNQKLAGNSYSNVDLRYHYDLYSIKGDRITKHSDINSKEACWVLLYDYFNHSHLTQIVDNEFYFRTSSKDWPGDRAAYISKINVASNESSLTKVVKGYTDERGQYYETGVYGLTYGDGKFYYYGDLNKIIGLFSVDLKTGKQSLLDIVQQLDSVEFKTEYSSKGAPTHYGVSEYFTMGSQDIYYHDSLLIYQKDGYVHYADTSTFKGIRYFYIDFGKSGIDTTDSTISIPNLYLAENKGFKVYPNPSSNSFYVLGDKTNVETISIWNAAGSLVKQLNVQDLEYSMHDIPNGMYFIQINDKKGLQKLKWIKQ